MKFLGETSKKLYQITSVNYKGVRYCNKVPRRIVIQGDIIGQPNPVSNIRPITFNIPHNESVPEKEFRLKRQQVQQWHEDFWEHHNSCFMKERREFVEALQEGKNSKDKLNPITADEISLFYKSFLDKYWKTHVIYNFNWYIKNINLVMLALRVEIHRFRRQIL